MTHLAMQFCVDGKYFAQTLSVGENANLVKFFEEQKHLIAANVFPSKKAANETATAWNTEAKKNGNYYYDDYL